MFLTGEAGVGKTALAENFEDICRTNGFEILKCRCMHYESATPYIPIMEALGKYFKIEESDEKKSPVSGMLMSLRGMVRGEERNENVSLSDKRESMFDRVTNKIIELSKEKPVLLFLDDLQWIDEASVRLLHYLARHISDHRVFLLGAYRGEEFMQMNDLPLTGVLSRMTEERLLDIYEVNSFSLRHTSEMVMKRLGKKNLPRSFLSMIHKTTGGNPYYIIEILDSILEEGMLDPHTHTLDTERDLSDITVPASIIDLIQRRLDSLSKEEKTVLSYASVIGTEFDFRVLERCTRMNVIELLDIIDDLKTGGLIQEKGDFQKEVYRFTHVQTRTVIYDKMSKSRKRVLHLQVGNVVEEICEKKPEAHYYTLSKHFLFGKDFHKAYEYSVKAGNKAMQSFALESALEFFENALLSVKSARNMENAGKKEEELLKTIGEIRYDMLEWDRAIGTNEDILNMSNIRGNGESDADTLKLFGNIGRGKKELQEARVHLEKILQKTENVEDECEIAVAHKGLGYIKWKEGLLDDAFDHYLKVIEMAEVPGSEKYLPLAYIEMGQICAHKGDNDLATQYYEKSLPLLKESESFWLLAKTYNNIGIQYMNKGDCDTAIEMFEKCEDIARESGNKMWLGASYYKRAEALSNRGDTIEARIYANKAEKVLKSINDQTGLSSVYKVLGMINRDEGKLEEAFESFRLSNEITRKLEIPFKFAKAILGLAEVCMITGETEKAKINYQEALDILERIGARQLLEQVKNSLNSLTSDQG